MSTLTTRQAFDLALQHHQAGRLAEAEALYRQILAAQPRHADALHYLGVIAHQAGRLDLAVEWIRQALVLQPNNPAAHSNLGNALQERGQSDEAMTAYRRSLELKPDAPEVLNNLGNLLGDRGQFDDAMAMHRRALEIKPGYAEAHYNLGNVFRERGYLDEAMAAYRRALELKPDYAEAHNNLGLILAGWGQLDEGVAAYRRALEIKPYDPYILNNLGGALKNQGQLDEAMAIFRRAIQAKPEHAGVHSNLVYTFHFHPGQDERAIAGAQQRWNRQFSEPVKRLIQPHTNDRSPGRRLRIGYVSPEFWDHVTGRYLLPLFQCHDHRDFEILCYAGVERPDHLTEEFRRRSDRWRDTVGVTDEALAAMIRQDGVDILVDLTQHLAGNRLPMFARQPAPVQASFAGYPASTGLETIGYRISDRYLEGGDSGVSDVIPARSLPSNMTTEKVFLLDSFWCYAPCGVEVEANGLPAQESGRVTFGCLNNFCKVNEPVLGLWARVLETVKDSRLVMLSYAGSHRQRTLDVLLHNGVEAHRVKFVVPRLRNAYLELYHRLDIVLDPFPYNGHTTSLDALWMGVPVVSLAGEQAVSRAGLSQLSNVGLPELVAFSEDDYVRIATQLAHDLPRLVELRATLRPRMEASPLMDAPRFTRSIESAYRAMWQQWCLP